MKKIKKIHQAISAPIDDLVTYRAMPTRSINYLDPFLFLNHHGPQVYPPNNNGLPFGPHPHRGFETLTFIFKGDLTHWDSGGGKSTIREGGIQWMTAGRGLIHAEISSEEFKKEGGEVELIQLWFNLPAKLKLAEPKYFGFQKEDIPEINNEKEGYVIHPISGNWTGTKGAVEAPTGIEIADIHLRAGGVFTIKISENRNVLFYVVRGKVEVNGKEAAMHQLVEFDTTEGELRVKAMDESLLLIGHGQPYNEPIVAQGPFVMNSTRQIQEAYEDYQQGKLGSWENFS